MKTLAIIFSVLISTAVYATDPVGTAVAAKAANLTEVISNIEYPKVSRENGIEGRVVVQVKVDADGSVSSSKILSSPCESLSKAVETAVATLQFAPAKNALGDAVPSSVKIPIDFELTID